MRAARRRAGVAKPRRSPEEQPDRQDEDRREVTEQQRPDRRLRERVHAVHDAAPREEGTQDREREGRDHERDVPGPQEPSLLLDHHGVQIGGRREPRHDRRVLDGIPCPVAAPAEHRVAPPRAGHDADAEERPRHEREVPRRHEPAVPALTEDERRDRVGEGDRGEHVTEVQKRRVQGHERVVLQQRIGTVAVVGRERQADEGVGGRGRHEQQEEAQHREEHGERRRPETRQDGRAADRHEGRRAREDRRPEEDRPFERGPETGERVQERGLARVVLRDVEDREVVGREREHHGKRRDDHERERDRRGDAGRAERPRIPSPGGVDRRPGAPERQEQRGAERAGAEIAGAHGNEVRCAGVAPAFGAV